MATTPEDITYNDAVDFVAGSLAEGSSLNLLYLMYAGYFLNSGSGKLFLSDRICILALK